MTHHSLVKDAVNRRIAMTMMIDTAKSADQTQFILITPQEMGVSSHILSSLVPLLLSLTRWVSGAEYRLG